MSSVDRSTARQVRPWRCLALGGASVLCLLVAGCSSGSSTGSAGGGAGVTTTVHRTGLPPADQASLHAIVAPLLAPFGDDVQRVELNIDATGAHRAMFSIYARPRQARTPDQYAAAIAPLARALIPVLLARYPGLYSVDLCQEALHPPADVDEPPPITRVLLARSALGEFDWPTLTLADIRRKATGNEPPMQLYVTNEVGASATFRAAAPK